MKKLNFYSVYTKKKFITDNYKIVKLKTKRGIRHAAVAMENGKKVYRFVGGSNA